VSVVCDEPQFVDDHRDTLLNPLVIIEILSPSTEKYDRGNKFENYEAIPSLREYVLIRQDRVRVEHYTRPAGADEWGFKAENNPGAAVRIPAIDVETPLTDLYAKVKFQPERVSLHGETEGDVGTTDADQEDS
jgi:Uma2 family endonuclease